MGNLSVLAKQEYRPKVANANSVSFFRYLEIDYDGIVFRLLPKLNNQYVYTINGITHNTTYSYGNVSITFANGLIWFKINSYLKVSWDGDQTMDIMACQTLKKLVCGLCGNYDGKHTIKK